MLAYVGQITLAQREWQYGDAALAWHHLESCQGNLRGWEYRYLYTLFTKNQVNLKGHTSAINSVAFSPDGKRLVSGSEQDGEGLGCRARAETLTLKGHRGPVWSVAFSPDGQRIVSGSADNTLKVWDAMKGSEK